MVLSLALLGPRTSSADAPEVGAELGFSQRALYRVPIELVSFGGFFGGQSPHVAYGLPFGVEWGKTFEGLTVFQGRLGLLVEGIVGRARFGGGLGVGGLSIARATNSNSLGAMFIDTTFRISADIVRFGASRSTSEDELFARPALFVASELRVNTAQVWGPSLTFGVRY
jgi:hypothetical protein